MVRRVTMRCGAVEGVAERMGVVGGCGDVVLVVAVAMVVVVVVVAAVVVVVVVGRERRLFAEL